MNATLNSFDLMSAADRLIAADKAEECGMDAEAWMLRAAIKDAFYESSTMKFTAPLTRKQTKAIADQIKGFKGRKIKAKTAANVKTYSNYWDDGSRSYYYVFNGTKLVRRIPDSMEVCDVEIPAGCMVVEHSFFCGKDCGITINASVETLYAAFGK